MTGCASGSLTKEMIDFRIEPQMRAYREVLGAVLNTNQQAILRVMLSFSAWRTLVHEGELVQSAAVGGGSRHRWRRLRRSIHAV